MSSPPISWENIRPIDDSRRLGFEELCCQLARAEVPESADFRRKGSPDAGVECLARVGEDGWGWQAKFFTSPPDAGQWRQLDESVETALDRHQDLARYYICMPLDRPDPRIEGRSDMMDRWNERVERWTEWAGERDVEFIYWGQSELIDRLTRDEHRGRLRYWFDREILSRAWFQEQVNRATEREAGPRYTPEVHVDLPIVDHFDALGRTDRFFRGLKQHHREISDKLSSVRRSTSENSEEYQQVEEADSVTERILELLREIDTSPTAPLPFGKLGALVEEAYQPIRKAEDLLRETETNVENVGDSEDSEDSNRPDLRRDNLSNLRRALDDLRQECEGVDARLANDCLMLLVGEAGTGKTHLLCDVAQKRLEENRPTVLLMGQRFTSSEAPWTQALRHLGLPGLSPDEFVGALEARAQAAGEKALFMVDALNEGRGQEVWGPHLPSFVDRLLSSEWISVALSVRTSYEQFIIPDGFSEQCVRIQHSGFEGEEYSAVQTFFDYYGIEQPSTPLLAPEFQNPLFLKVLCNGLTERGVARLPRGSRGITTVFGLFLDAVNGSLSSELGYPERRKYVHEAVRRVAEMMARRKQQWLPWREAEETIEEILPRSFDTSFYRNLISEGVLVEDIHYLPEEEKHVELTHFAYERFADHAIIDELIEEHEGGASPEENRESVVADLEALFEADGPLHFLVGEGARVGPGLISALCVQIPERFGVELFEVVPEITERHSYPESFFQSIVWRRTDAFSEKTIDALNQAVWNEHHFRRSIDTLIQVTTTPDHPFNADFLHSQLIDDEMPVRDEWWSTYLHDAYQSEGKVHRLVEWALESTQVDEAAEDTVRLCAVALIWFLTSSNRFLRDRTTKGLVRLLSGRERILEDLIIHFSDVDDLYVQERLFAVAYGCAMKSHDASAVGELAETVYVEVFQDPPPTAHILLRDYARGVIERALFLGDDMENKEDQIRPPYGSTWPEIPSEEENSIYEEQPILSEESDHTPDDEPSRAQRQIVLSVTGWDFARYVIGTNSGRPNWLDIPITEPTWRSAEEELNAFIASLPEESQKHWEEFQAAENEYKQITWKPPIFEFDNEEKDEVDQTEVENDGENEAQELSEAIENFNMRKEVAEDRRQEAWQEFLNTLSDDQKQRAIELWTVKEESHGSEEIPYFDLSKLQRWILQRVFDLGWTEDRFGYFDERMDTLDHSRDAKKPERIGKKYQWIAYHEIMARLADNFQYRESLAGKEPERKYWGPWQEGLHLRDIDPSCTVWFPKDGEYDGSSWYLEKYNSWQEDRENWTRETEDLPATRELLVPADEDGVQYVRMNGFLKWSEPVPPEYDRFDRQQSEVWFMPMAYLVRDEHLDELVEWAEEQDFYGRWMPEPGSMHDLFLGEYCWSPAANYYQCRYYGGEEWNFETAPVPIHTATTEYGHGMGSHDCSYEEGGTVRLPSCLLRRKMNLHWSGAGSQFVDGEGTVRAFDTRLNGADPGSCLIELGPLLDMLNREYLTAFWVLVGEKQVLRPIGQTGVDSRMIITGFYTLQDRTIQGFTEHNMEAYQDGERILETIQTHQHSFEL